MPRFVRAGFVLAAALAAAACAGAAGPAPRPGATLLEVSLPDVSRLDETVQAQARQRYDALLGRIRAGRSGLDLGAAYGELGMVLQAAQFYDAAEPALRNAQQLMPDELRWPYYLGHLYQRRGELTEAEAAFTRTLQLAPGDVATLVWLGRLYLDTGRVEDARQLFSRAAAGAPEAIAVLAGLGQVELERGRYQAAAAHFERALQIDPAAASLHAPLAAAYTAMKQLDRAEMHRRLWADGDILVPDPLQQELDMLLETPLANELRGIRALDVRDWGSAAAYFRKGLGLEKENSLLRRSLQHKLGTALHLAGDAAAAEREFAAVVAAAPPTGPDEATAKAHYSLGVIMMARGRRDVAASHFGEAVRFQPTYLEARLALAEVLRRTGKVRESLPHYRAALEVSPQAGPAKLGYAMGLIRLARYREARDELTAAVAAAPADRDLAHVLARLLAVAPDESVRNGVEAMRLLDRLMQGTRTTDLGETMAMALAELGDFEKAAAVQRGVLEVVRRGGDPAAIRRLEENLGRYERRQPCRVFWEENSPDSSFRDAKPMLPAAGLP